MIPHSRITPAYTAITWMLVALMIEPQTRLIGQESSTYIRALEVLLTPTAKSSTTSANPPPILMAQAQSFMPGTPEPGSRRGNEAEGTVAQVSSPPHVGGYAPESAVDTNLLLNLTRTPVTLTNGNQLLALSFFSDSNHNYVVEFRDDIGLDLCNNWQPLTNAPHNYGILFTEASVTNRFYRLRKIDVPRSPLFALLANDTGTNSLDGVTYDPTITGMALKFPQGTVLQGSLDHSGGPFTTITNLGAPRHVVITRGWLNTIQGGPLADGPHVLHLRADNGGQTLASFELSFTLDTTPPAVTVSLASEFDSPPLGDGRTAFNPVTLNGRTEPGARLEFLSASPSPGGEGGWIIHTITPDSSGSFTLTNIVLADGTNQFYFRALDAACNETNTLTQLCWLGPNCSFPDNLEGWTVAASEPSTLISQPVRGSVSVASDKSCAAVMIEGDSFLVTLSRELVIPTLPSVLTISYAPSFDPTTPNAMRDAFEVALVDSVGRPLTYTIQGSNAVTSASVSTPLALPPSPDACFNHTDGQTPFTAPGVALSQIANHGFQILVDVSHLPPGSTARLILRLVNNDGDRTTTVRITGLDFHTIQEGAIFPGSHPPALSLNAGISASVPASVHSISDSCGNQVSFSLGNQASSQPANGANLGFIALSGASTDPLSLVETNDLWDVTRGVSVVANSGSCCGSSISTIFGDRHAGPEDGATGFFRDDQPSGFVHSLEWRTPSPVTIRSYRLFAGHDSDTLRFDRAFSAFRLFAFDEVTRQFQLHHQFSPPLPYSSSGLAAFAFDVPATTAQRFRAEFVQHSPSDFPGPRIYELDGFGYTLSRSLVGPEVNIHSPANNARLAPSTVLLTGRASFPSKDAVPLSVLTFETTPGFVADEGMVLSNHFSSSHGVRFHLENGSYPRLALAGSPRTAFQSIFGEDAARPDQGVGSSFLVSNQGDSNTPAPLIIIYDSPVASAAGEIVDIDSSTNQLVMLSSDGASGWYNEALGQRLDGSSQFFALCCYGVDPFIPNVPEPDLLPVAAILGTWLSANPLPLNANWAYRPIPFSWSENSETAVIFEIDAGPGGILGATANVGVDNGFAMWVNGYYRYGAVAGGGAIQWEYPNIPLGPLVPGTNYIQVIREDHGFVNGFTMEVNRTVVAADDWLVEARNSEGQVIEAIHLGASLLTAGDGLATRWRFERGRPDISSVRISYVGTLGTNVGYAFDNITGSTLAGENRISVTVNGLPVDALDPAGNFFSAIEVRPGQNVYEVVATDAFDQSTTNSITVYGETCPQNFASLGEVSASVVPEYGRTSFNEWTKVLYADLALRNAGTYPIRAPFYVGITRISDPSVKLLSPDGVSSDGIPYYDYSATLTTDSLTTGSLTTPRALAFHNPNKVQFTYDLVVLGQLNQAPYFTTVPTLEAIVGKPYTYPFHATDPDSDPLTYTLLSAPTGMVLNAQLSTLNFQPSTNDLGTHDIRLRANDGKGGVAEQHYLLNVINPPSNRPPYFVSTPVTVARILNPNINEPQPFQLKDWSVIDYPGTWGDKMFTTNPGAWRVSSDSMSVTQLNNADATIFLSPVVHSNVVIKGNFRLVDDGSLGFFDNDFVGLVFGYQDNRHFYLFDWAIETESWPDFGEHLVGMSVKVVNSDTDFDFTDFWQTFPTNGQITTIFHNSIPLRNFVDYSVALDFSSPDIKIQVKEGTANIAQIELADATYGAGKFGFYNYSQAFAAYSGFSRRDAPHPSYAYDADARDPDLDPLTYSLVVAPTNMTINPVTGLIHWAPTAEQVGTHDVTVLVQDDRGGVASQSYRICVLPDESPVFTPLSVDLAISDVTKSSVLFDAQALTVSGVVSAVITSHGPDDVRLPFALTFFEDRNTNELFDPSTDSVLGKAFITNGLTSGQSAAVSVPVSGIVQFAGVPVWAFVDSGRNIAESNERNNVAREGCEGMLQVGQFDPIVKWHRDAFGYQPSAREVMMAPAVVDLDGDRVPEIVFISFGHAFGNGSGAVGVLRALRGSDGAELWSVEDQVSGIEAYGGLAVADIDNDGRPEIIVGDRGRRLLAFEHEGTFKWRSAPYNGLHGWGSSSIADLDHDGIPEIIIGNQAFNGDGTVRWNGASAGGLGHGDNGAGPLSVVADIDLDGHPEVIAGKSAYRFDGSLYWNAPIGDGFAAIGNFDLDPEAEIVVVTAGNINLLEHDGRLKWGPVPIPGGGAGGAPTLADMDGDGRLDIGVVGRSRYVTFNGDGSVKWQVPTQDGSSETTGSSVFDFDGDGKAEIVYGDEQFLRIYRGTDGLVLYQLPKSSSTTYELPVIADVDGDGNSEIVAVANGSQKGIYVIGDRNDTWVSTRSIWNQHSYHINNVNDDGTIPRFETNSWQTHNTYRLNALPTRSGTFTAPDLVPSLVQMVASNSVLAITVRIGNGGLVPVSSGLEVAFYNGTPRSGGVFLGKTQTSIRLSPGLFEDLTFTTSSNVLSDLWIVADDDGSGRGIANECNETNNYYHPDISLPWNNNAPRFASIPVTAANEGRAYHYDADATDADASDVLAYSLALAPAGMTIDPATGLISWTPGESENGQQPVMVVAEDSRGERAFQSFFIQVQDSLNTSPRFVGEPPAFAFATQSLAYQPAARDADGDVLHLDLVAAPEGMFLETNEIVLIWRPLLNQLGTHEVILRVQDGRGGVALQSWQINVLAPNSAPVITTFPPGPAVVNLPWRYIVRAQDAEGQALVFSVGSNSPAGLSFNDHSSTTNSAVLEWTPALTNIGSNTIEIIVRDEDGLEAQQSFDLEVAPSGAPNRSPQFTSAPRTQTRLGLGYSYLAQATDPDGDSVTISLVNGPGGMVLNNGSLPGEGIIQWTPQALGSFPVSLAVNDGRPGGVVTQHFNINVTSTLSNAAPLIVSQPPLHATDEQPYVYDLAAEDADGDPLVWRLVQAPVGISLNPNTGALRWVPTVNQLGTNTVIVEVQDSLLATATQSWQIDVGCVNRPPQITSVPPTTANAGEPYLYVARAEDPDGDALTFSFVNTGEVPSGMTLSNLVTSPGSGAGAALIRWSPSASQAGPHLIRLRVRDGRGGENEQTYTLHVIDERANRPPYFISTPVTVAVVAQDAPGSTTNLVINGNFEFGDFNNLDSDPRAEIMLLSSGSTNLAGWTVFGPLGVHWMIPRTGGTDGSHVLDLQGLSGAPSSAIETSLLTIPGSRYTLTFDALTGANLNTAVVTVGNLQGQGFTGGGPGDGDLFANLATRQEFSFTAIPNTTTLHFEAVTSDGFGPVIDNVRIQEEGIGSYVYDSDALDPDGDSLTYLLATAPTGMSINASNGLIRWAPTTNQIGTHQVMVVATDGRGGAGIQNYTVQVLAPRVNRPPQITSTPIPNAVPGVTYRYDVFASDPDGDALTYALSAPVPSGLAIDSLGRMAWTPSFAQTGSFPVLVTVSDPFGGSTNQSFTITVAADTQPPTVSLTVGYNLTDDRGNRHVRAGSETKLRVVATDNVGVASRELRVAGQPVPLGADGSALVSFPTSGEIEAIATARDFAGNIGTVTNIISVVDPNAPGTVTVVIHSPTNSAEITQPIPVYASITSQVALREYRLELAPIDGDFPTFEIEVNDPRLAFQTITNATLPANVFELANASLGQIDPTILLNGGYLVRLTAFDRNGNSHQVGVLVNVSGNLKFGEFRLEFIDLNVPVAGIPITIRRVYDSRESRREGDFGHGWSLGVQDAHILEVGKRAFYGLDEEETTFTSRTRVFMFMPDGRRVGFNFTPEFAGAAIFFGAFYRPAFTSDAGVYERLEPLDAEAAYSFTSDGSFVNGFAGISGYDPSGYRLRTRDNLVYVYNQSTGLQNVTDPNGNRLEYTRDGIFHYNAGSVVSDQAVQFIRDTRGRITRIIDPNGKSLTYSYDGAGDLRSFADQSTNTTRYFYSASRAHFLTNIVDPLGRSALGMEYDSTGRLKTVRDANGNPISQDFDPTTKAATFTDGNGSVIHTRFDDNGNETYRRIDGVYTNTLAYDANNNLLASTNGRGFSTNYTYDVRGKVTAIRDSLGNRTTIAYSGQNKPTGVTNALGQILSLSYNSSGQLTQVVNNAGFKTSVARDAQGRVVSLTDATGTNNTVFDYSNGCACGRPGKVINPDGSFRLYEYNSQGLTNRVVNELGAETLFHHDDSGRLLWMRDPLTNYTQFFYNGPLLTNVVDALGRSTRYEYDSLNRTNKIIDAEGGVVEFRYDNNGNRTHVTDSVTNITTFVYDAANRLTQQIDPLGHTNFFAYDAAGNRTEAIDRNGRRRTFAYDAANRMTNELWWEGTNVVRSIVFGFNELGVQTLAADPAARYEYTYDSLNRLERVLSQSAGVPDFTLFHTYTALGQVASVTDNWGVRVGSSYDNRNRFSSRTWSSTLPGAGVDPARVDFAYDVSGNRVRTDRFSDLAGTNRIGFTTNAYNRAGIVTNITHLGPASQVLAKYDYNFDAAFQITRWAINNQLSDFAYDRTGQLTNALNTAQPNENFRFDANGNRVGAQSGGSYVVGRNNQILSDGTNGYAYDFEGNMTSRSNTVTGVLTTYQWDHRNRLVSVLDHNPGSVVTQTVAFVYDAMNRRLAKTVNGQTTRFLYNGDDSWADLDASNAVSARYLHGARIDELLARQRASDGRGWYLTDHLGTVRDIASAAGAVVAHVDYSSFGQVLGVSNPAAVDRFLFTGRELDDETGLSFYRARYYSPTVGRFVSNDPIGFVPGDLNLYRYVRNSPLIGIDPSGELFVHYANLVLLSFVLVFVQGVACGSTDTDALLDALVAASLLGLASRRVGAGTLRAGIIFGVVGFTLSIFRCYSTDPKPLESLLGL